MDQLINQVKYAINALSAPNETRNANDWLISFEKSSEAWSASEQLLNEPPGMYRFFGAKFLYSKIQKQCGAVLSPWSFGTTSSKE